MRRSVALAGAAASLVVASSLSAAAAPPAPVVGEPAATTAPAAAAPDGRAAPPAATAAARADANAASPKADAPAGTAGADAAAPTTAAPPDAPAAPEASSEALSEEMVGGGSEAGSEGQDTPKLEIYGFADFSYLQSFGNRSNLAQQYVIPYPSFYVGHLNMYLASTLGENWRGLAEVRFVYSPLGDDHKQASDGTFPVVATTTNDYAEVQRFFDWGGIEIQRAWLEYQPWDFLAIRGGQWLTPYGYWNDDHGSPTIITVRKPLPIGDAMFPERQTGLMAWGRYFFGSSMLGYALTLSNGRGPYDAIRDLDTNKAIGGRLYYETSAFGTLTVGVAGYRGRYTASTKRYRVDGVGSNSPSAVVYRTIDSAYDELSLGADLRFLYGGLHLQAEVMMNEAAYDERHRPRLLEEFSARPMFAADYRRFGGYVLLGYRMRWHGVMPYLMTEHSNYANFSSSPPVWLYTVGLNVRPTANVALKAELGRLHFSGVGSTGLGRDDLWFMGTQAAWAF